MNEQIQQMIYSLNEKVGVHWTNEDKLKFAELIVQACGSFTDPVTRNLMMKHFGVEE